MPDALLDTRRQIALAIEDTEGTAQSLAAADAKLLVSANDLAYLNQTELFARNIVQSSLSRHNSLVGVELGGVTATVELRGSGSVATASPPSWKSFSRACGFVWSEAKKLTIGAITSGPFQHGETVTQATSGATARVFGRTANGVTTLHLIPVTGTLDGTNGLTGGTSGATATPSALAVGGWVLEPGSSSIPSATIGVFHDGVKKLLKGARGELSIRGNVGEPVMLTANFVGVLGGVTDVALLSGVTFETTVPPVLKGATLSLDGTYSPLATSVELMLGNTLAPRRSISAAEGALSVKISARRPTGKIDPEQDLVAGYDWHGKLKAGTTLALDLTIGSTEGNRFRIIAPQAQITAVAEGSREGISVYQVDLELNGGTSWQDKEVAILVY